MTFAKNAELLTQLGVEYTCEEEWRGNVPRHPVELPVFREVGLPLSDTDWCDLLQKHRPHYLGGCCSHLSSIHDQMYQWFAAPDLISVRDLHEVMVSLCKHDGFEGWDSLPQEFATLEDWVRGFADWGASDKPLQKMRLVWHLVRDYYDPEIPRVRARSVVPSEIEEAVFTVYKAINKVQWDFLFENGVREAHEIKSQVHADRAMVLSGFIPALNYLHENVKQLDLGPVEGWAIVDLDKGEEIARNGNGPCIFETDTEVVELFRLWNQHEESRTTPRGNPRPRYGVKRVRVSVEHGIESLCSPMVEAEFVFGVRVVGIRVPVLWTSRKVDL